MAFDAHKSKSSEQIRIGHATTRNVLIMVDIRPSQNPLSLSRTRFYPTDYALL